MSGSVPSAGGRSKKGSKGSKSFGRWVDPDPRGGLHLALPAHRWTPYTVVRDKQTSFIATNTATAGGVIVGAYGTGPDISQHSDLVACYGFGSSVPGTTETILRATNLNIGGQNANMRLHRMSVTLSCVGSSVAGVSPDGVCHVGALRTPIIRNALGTWANLAGFLVNRAETKSFSNYDLMRTGKHFAVRPIDVVEFEVFKRATPGAVGDTLMDTVTPICIAMSPTVAIVNLMLTIHTEWAVLYTSDFLLQSTASLHESASQSAWDRTSAILHSTSGAVGVAQDVTSLGRALSSFVGRNGPRVLPDGPLAPIVD